MAGGGGGSPAREGGGGRAEWLRIYDRMVAILRKNHRHVEALLADRARLEALVKVQHEFWVARDGLLRARLSETRRTEACVRKGHEARLELLLGDKERAVRRYQIYAKHQDDDLEDFKTCAVALAEENAKLKLKLEEAENSGELSEKTTEHEHSVRNWRSEIRELKNAYKNLSSEKDKEVSALLAEKDFVWNQYKTMERDYDSLLKKKKIEAAQATEAAQKLQRKVEELQVAAQKKDDDISRLQAEANGANKKILLLENKLQKLHSLASEEDDETPKVKGGHLQASQKRKQDISGTRRKSRSEVVSLRGKSKNNPQRQMVEDQPETSQKRQCASSLSNGVGLRRCSSRMHLKPASSPAPQQVLFHSSFKVPKLKTPAPPPPL
ncbi:uncharacterized protein LOC124667804 isoform X2 [Lolium rigidum]|uniref:uncharacterized protein LOC124667804 isoform X2 n=1 Tax=Lolium rigidum TaxID=89674 RepID=UPI001F5C8B13|nr:uncharacterized protein LOC124667804 isoform X2 [Lolium rigidum]